jgi:soluble lytic murein transglycosylase
MAWTREQREALRWGLVAVIRERPGHPESREALQYLATVAVDLTPHQALAIARLAIRSGQAGPAVRLYSRAGGRALTEPGDLLAYGSALATQRRHRDAIRILNRLASDPAFGPEALFYQARSYARVGDRRHAEAALARVFERASDDHQVRPQALFLAGDLAWQRGALGEARDRWTELVRRYPEADSVGRAGFLAALTIYEDGRTREAATEWERVHLLDGGSDGLAAGYWGARAWSEAGEASRAEHLWQSVMARDSASYYAFLSARRLGVEPWRPAPAKDEFARYTDVDRTMTRLQLLEALGMEEEANHEVDWLLRGPGVVPERALAIADGLRRIGQPAAAVAAARRALAVGAAPDARTYRLLYPWHYGESITEQASLVGVDPRLVAALIRQESSWEPRARSRVGAVGLMQVMPATGRLIARSLGVRGWRSDHLLEPATNVRFGTWFLAQSLRRWDGDLSRALAAYNAGGTRVPLWSTGRAANDPELFVERISFKETRDYVRIIQRNLVLYEGLYP